MCFYIVVIYAEQCGDNVDKSVFSRCPAVYTKAQTNKSIILQCGTTQEVSLCLWKTPLGINIRPMKDDFEYILIKPQDKTNCDMEIKMVTEDHVGKWECSPFFPESSAESTASGMLSITGR